MKAYARPPIVREESKPSLLRTLLVLSIILGTVGGATVVVAGNGTSFASYMCEAIRVIPVDRTRSCS